MTLQRTMRTPEVVIKFFGAEERGNFFSRAVLAKLEMGGSCGDVYLIYLHLVVAYWYG